MLLVRDCTYHVQTTSCNIISLTHTSPHTVTALIFENMNNFLYFYVVEMIIETVEERFFPFLLLPIAFCAKQKHGSWLRLIICSFSHYKKKTTGECCGRKSAQTQTLTNKYRRLFLSSHSQTLMHDVAPSQPSTPTPRFFNVYEQSWHNTSRHGEPTHRLDKLETSQSIRVSFCLLFLPVWLWSPLMIIKPTGTRHMMLSVSQIWICLLAKSSLNKTEGGGCHCALLLLLTSQDWGGGPSLCYGFSCGYV